MLLIHLQSSKQHNLGSGFAAGVIPAGRKAKTLPHSWEGAHKGASVLYVCSAELLYEIGVEGRKKMQTQEVPI